MAVAALVFLYRPAAFDHPPPSPSQEGGEEGAAKAGDVEVRFLFVWWCDLTCLCLFSLCICCPQLITQLHHSYSISSSISSNKHTPQLGSTVAAAAPHSNGLFANGHHAKKTTPAPANDEAKDEATAAAAARRRERVEREMVSLEGAVDDMEEVLA